MAAESQPPTAQSRHSDERAIRDVIRKLEFSWNAHEPDGMAYHTITIERVSFLSANTVHVQVRVHSRILDGESLLDEHSHLVATLASQGEPCRWQIISVAYITPN